MRHTHITLQKKNMVFAMWLQYATVAVTVATWPYSNVSSKTRCYMYEKSRGKYLAACNYSTWPCGHAY